MLSMSEKRSCQNSALMSGPISTLLKNFLGPNGLRSLLLQSDRSFNPLPLEDDDVAAPGE